ncbi:MAG: hypothetical protein K2N34_10685, partial [Lachnospiraceae bacterium]|nr:hypothetical protein [Lachnospiraceae bacterium]
MKKTKLLIGAVSVLCVLSLAGCNTDVNNNTHNTNDITNTGGEKSTVTDGTNNSSTNNSTGNNDANSLFELSTIQGSVINFSDDGCMIT